MTTTLYEKLQDAAIRGAVVDPATGRKFDRNSFTADDILALQRLHPRKWPYAKAYLTSWPADSTRENTLGGGNNSGYPIRTLRNKSGTYKLL
jgi:hypothetical protein